jgi:hypothetical protein
MITFVHLNFVIKDELEELREKAFVYSHPKIPLPHYMHGLWDPMLGRTDKGFCPFTPPRWSD